MRLPAVFLIISLASALVWEIRGAWDRRKGDTISEGVWWVRDRLPKPVWYGLLTGLAALYGWSLYHFQFQG